MVRDWLDNRRASSLASGAVAAFDLQVSPDPDVMSVAEVVKLLDRDGYRLIRSADDLLDSTIEALGKVASDVGYDLSMLYGKPKRIRTGQASARISSREHLDEDALQTYLRLRLSGCLSEIANKIEVKVLREDQIAHRQRVDLRVVAPCHRTGKLATVVVEVKWSDNDETRTGLVEQLGRRYLLDEKLTHGIFVVGWTGKWSSGAGKKMNNDRSRLMEHLVRQRDEFCKAAIGAGLRIEPFVVDLRWSRT
jgi:hypothetical protein